MSHPMSTKTRFIKNAVWILCSIPLIHLFAEESFDLSSDSLEASREQTTPLLYGNALNGLKHAVKPRWITLIDTRHIAQHLPVNREGVLFTFYSRSAQTVQFTAQLPGFSPKPMSRNPYGVFTYFYSPDEIVHTTPNKKIRYKFLIDGIFSNDPTHDSLDTDNAGNIFSVFYLNSDHFSRVQGTHILDTPVNFGREVLFRIQASNADSVSLSGDFNHWRPFSDYLKKTEDGFFEIRKILPPGEYTYVYRIDGKISRGTVASGKYKKHPIYGKVNHLRIQ